MPNSRARPKCGVFLPLVDLSWEELLARVRLVEGHGFESCWVDDHFWFPGAPDRAHLEVWTALTALAMATERIELGPLVMCHSYRQPGLIAKMAASLAEVSGARLTLGLGAGYMDDEYRAYGYAVPSGRERLERLEETLEILRRLWTDERATFEGKHHSIRDAPLVPKPERLPVLLGGAGERFLPLVARYADVWNCPNPAWRDLGTKRDQLVAECERIGRDPSAIEVSEQVVVVLGRGDEQIRRETDRARAALGGFARFDGDVHVGSPEQVAEGLRARQAIGVETFIVMFGDWGGPEQIDLFGSDVLPLLT
ncbi:MAG: LLM class flavin-dependent oxidoreductase [Candidatus Binatia bacterium]|nr:LLM class flavin-dependent oxidoreductase [Candidatus Binatia bacterium]